LLSESGHRGGVLDRAAGGGDRLDRGV